MESKYEIAVFGGGCFWCTEAVFAMLKGVISVEPGYAGGTVTDPTYEEVSTGTTGHAEVTRVVFDPTCMSFDTLMTVFFASHDPSTLNRQGNDVGTQYRSVIFYTTPEQKGKAIDMIAKLERESREGNPIVTEVTPLEYFWSAEDYHKKYYARHKEQAYCQLVINPKLKKIQKEFAELLEGKSLES
ncbi:MAG: peptide-methionine (S)-S-oxide reductase MsrA [Candidatus Pacebacteria bacterium]|jgi:peptide-methionine (S)-S-oxide reductase|nr:peptide-methionine (S)-S-oxide reductase MsrA [Candidatus Paceibacterota bacterium]